MRDYAEWPDEDQRQLERANDALERDDNLYLLDPQVAHDEIRRARLVREAKGDDE